MAQRSQLHQASYQNYIGSTSKWVGSGACDVTGANSGGSVGHISTTITFFFLAEAKTNLRGGDFSMCCGLNHLVALYSVVPDSLGVYVQETKTSIRHLYILSLHLQYDYCLDPKISVHMFAHFNVFKFYNYLFMVMG